MNLRKHTFIRPVLPDRGLKSMMVVSEYYHSQYPHDANIRENASKHDCTTLDGSIANSNTIFRSRVVVLIKYYMLKRLESSKAFIYKTSSPRQRLKKHDGGL